MVEARLTDDEAADTSARYKRWRKIKLLAVFALMLAVGALTVADRLGAFGYAGDDRAFFDGRTVRVVKVVDGDTVKIRGRRGLESVRLIGIDAPEVGEPGADAATDALRELTDDPVQLMLGESETRDRYGRLLAHLFAGDTHVNRRLIADGHAYAERRFPHVYQRDFAAAEATARGKTLGLWRTHTDEDQPEWRRRWLETLRDDAR